MQTNKQRKKQVTNKKISQLSQDGIISTNLLFKVKMYSNLVSTIPAALFVSFLGPISDQVPNPTNPYLIIFRWGGRFRWRSPSSATFSSPACSCSMSMPRIGLWKQLSPRFSKIWVWITFYMWQQIVIQVTACEYFLNSHCIHVWLLKLTFCDTVVQWSIFRQVGDYLAVDLPQSQCLVTPTW